MSAFNPERRRLLQATAAAGAAAAASMVPAEAGTAAPAKTTASPSVNVLLRVNGTDHQVMLDPRTTLLDALRERLRLTGTKKGCDQGQCGACTVIVDGRRIVSCLTLAVMQEGHDITTIEGLGTPTHLHPMQAAFVKHDGYQCGFCTPGQICSAVAMLEEMKAGVPSHVTGNLNQPRSEEHTSELQSLAYLVCRLLLEKKKTKT